MVALLLASGAKELKASLEHSEAVAATQQALTSTSNVERLANSKAQVDAPHPITGRTALHEVPFQVGLF